MKPEPCVECGSTTHVASMVDSDGRHTCAACYIGLTAMVRAGIPIAPLGNP